jgi:hypothetical protein
MLSAYKFWIHELTGKPWRVSLVYGLQDNIKIHLKVVVMEGLDWIQVTHNNVQRCAVLNTVTKQMVSIKIWQNLTNSTIYLADINVLSAVKFRMNLIRKKYF